MWFWAGSTFATYVYTAMLGGLFASIVIPRYCRLFLACRLEAAYYIDRERHYTVNHKPHFHVVSESLALST